MTLPNRPASLLTACLCAAVITAGVHDADAVGTRRFVLNTLSSFEGGDLEGVSVASDGTVRAGWSMRAAPIPDATSVWSSVVLPDGTVLLGTSAGGRVYKVKAGKVSIAAETGAMAVSALAIAFDGDVIAGSFPEGKLFRLKPGALNGQKVQPWIELKDTEDIWGLAYDAKNKQLYAATGPKGKLFRIDARAKAEIFFDSEEPHLVSVALHPDGGVLAGSNGKGLLYKLTGPGRSQVLHDFDTTDVKAIRVAKDGSIYAIANTYRGSTKGLRPRRGRNGLRTAPQRTKKAQPGKGELLRFDKRGTAEVMLKDGDTHFVSLELDEAGVPYVGTGADGQVFAVDANHVTRLVADTDERQVGAMSVVGKQRFVVTSDPVVFHEITGSGGVNAVWTSKVLDAGMRAHFGLLDWRAGGTVEIQTRTGNTSKPDKTWSPWSRASVKPGKVTSPAARYLQIRSRWGRDKNAVLREVRVAFVTDNARALLTSVTAGEDQTNTGGNKVPKSGGPLDNPDAKIKIRWKVENPDKDQLRYRVYYRPLTGSGKSWVRIGDDDEILTSSSLKWDTTGVPEGRYEVRVDASDELANPPDRVTRHSLTSRTVLVDNTPPRLNGLTLKGGKLTGRATDGLGPIARIEFSLLGTKTWWPLFPTDDVFDEAQESFASNLGSLAPPVGRLVVVRAYDAAGNAVTGTVRAAP